MGVIRLLILGQRQRHDVVGKEEIDHAKVLAKVRLGEQGLDHFLVKKTEDVPRILRQKNAQKA